EAVAGRGLAVDLVLRPWQLPVAVAVARAHPGSRFVLDHVGNPPQGREEFTRWSSVLQELAASGNVVAKVSGLLLVPVEGKTRPPLLEEILDVAVTAFGPGRLMFGSDWPLVELSGGYRHWVDLYVRSTRSFSVDEQQKMDERTALDTYRRTR
ncbi:amidohydrolase family protein, partial [Microbacterium sp. CFBP 8801]|uniref:amidohydrolase family protein n=1 Tax=Microbacterium sp. CFBP 8801 TaxID=2774036 RepID=UPI00177D3287